MLFALVCPASSAVLRTATSSPEPSKMVIVTVIVLVARFVMLHPTASAAFMNKGGVESVVASALPVMPNNDAMAKSMAALIVSFFIVPSIWGRVGARQG